MKFSLLIELQIESPTPASERQAFLDCVEQAVLADELGYHCLWAVEHHGLFEYSHCSAPEVLLSFIAARTTRVRLGHSVTLTPHRYNHPIRIAERVATLDILSGGRVSWGSGKSSSLVEQGAFEIERAELDGQWREALEMIPRMWRSDVFEWNGTCYHVPPTPIIPKPVQTPHPPMFAACTRPESVTLAGELGLGSLNFSAGNDAYLRQKVDSYRAALTRSAVPAHRRTTTFCCTPATLVLPDDRRACEFGFRGNRFFSEGLAAYFFSTVRTIGAQDVSRGALSPAELRDASMARTREGGTLATIIGDPAVARETVSRFEQAGVDELILVMQMGTIPHSVVMESMRTFAEQVMPHFQGTAAQTAASS
jgi:alkanesulfonate monooxygenase SsuD/methylene tetrahydromethanopterin reductase-like flavin-dependent oxidoreductase (luciferase family)